VEFERTIRWKMIGGFGFCWVSLHSRQRFDNPAYGLPIVASWKDADGQVLCVAIGKFFDKMKN
jgi:hypothetical protein